MNRAYSSRIIKAGALLTDSKAFLLAYDESASPRENLMRLQRENPFGKASRSRVAALLPIFRQRYCSDPYASRSLRVLAHGGVDPEVLHRILYFYASRNDRVLYDFVVDHLHEKRRSGDLRVTLEGSERFIRATAKRAGVEWSRDTLRRVTQGVLATLRDFAVLEGSVRKRIAPVYVPAEAFAYLALALHLEGASGRALIDHDDWRLFLLDPHAVERQFLEAHQRRLLSFQTAGRIARVEFLDDSLEDAARGLIR